jgi:hypothetical protein
MVAHVHPGRPRSAADSEFPGEGADDLDRGEGDPEGPDLHHAGVEGSGTDGQAEALLHEGELPAVAGDFEAPEFTA